MRTLFDRVQFRTASTTIRAHCMDVLLVGLGRWVRSDPFRVTRFGVGPPLPQLIEVKVTAAESRA